VRPLGQRRYRGTTTSGPSIATAVLADPGVRLEGDIGEEGDWDDWLDVLVLPLDLGAWSFQMYAVWSADSPEARPQVRVLRHDPTITVSGGVHPDQPHSSVTVAHDDEGGTSGVHVITGTAPPTYGYGSAVVLQARGGLSSTDAATVQAGVTQGWAIKTGAADLLPS
jgi:hypothetical protein